MEDFQEAQEEHPAVEDEVEEEELEESQEDETTFDDLESQEDDSSLFDLLELLHADSDDTQEVWCFCSSRIMKATQPTRYESSLFCIFQFKGNSTGSIYHREDLFLLNHATMENNLKVFAFPQTLELSLPDGDDVWSWSTVESRPVVIFAEIMLPRREISMLLDFVRSTMGRTFFVGGNWKRNGTTEEVEKIVSTLNDAQVPSSAVVVIMSDYYDLPFHNILDVDHHGGVYEDIGMVNEQKEIIASFSRGLQGVQVEDPGIPGVVNNELQDGPPGNGGDDIVGNFQQHVLDDEHVSISGFIPAPIVDWVLIEVRLKVELANLDAFTNWVITQCEAFTGDPRPAAVNLGDLFPGVVLTYIDTEEQLLNDISLLQGDQIAYDTFLQNLVQVLVTPQ